VAASQPPFMVTTAMYVSMFISLGMGVAMDIWSLRSDSGTHSIGLGRMVQGGGAVGLVCFLSGPSIGLPVAAGQRRGAFEPQVTWRRLSKRLALLPTAVQTPIHHLPGAGTD